MLVVSRKLNERLWIGDDVCVTVLGIERGRVKLGIEAAPDVHIEREELRQPTKL